MQRRRGDGDTHAECSKELTSLCWNHLARDSSSESISFKVTVLKENAFIKNYFFLEKYLQHTFLTYILGKISFLLSQKVTAGCAGD